MNDMPLLKVKYIKTLISFYERYASIKAKYIKTLISFMNDMPLSKVKIYKNTNKFS